MALLDDSQSFLDRVKTTLLGCLVVSLIGVVEYLLETFTGHNFALTVFYALPIMYVVWKCGPACGMFPVALAVASDLSSVVYHHRDTSANLWATDSAFVFLQYLLITLMLVRIHADYRLKNYLAHTDSLTKINNRNAFTELVEAEIDRMRRLGPVLLTVVCIDIDRLKDFNKKRSRKQGDKLLRIIGQTLLSSVRTIDIVGRINGDEFGLVLLNMPPDKVQMFLDRTISSLRGELRIHDFGDVTLSVGAKTFVEPPKTVEDLTQAADDIVTTITNSGKITVLTQ